MKPTIDMTVSPYDRTPSGSAATPPLTQLQYRPKQRWVPSRYNARAVGEDGRLLLWNTLTGAMTVFRPDDRDAVVAQLSSQGVRDPLDKHGRYLSRRGFLVGAEVNELDLFRLRFARQHWRTNTLQLILLASEDCNFRCVYCYEKFKHGTMEPEVRRGVQALVEQRAPSLKHLSIGWFGGEPLYGWAAIEDLGPFFKSTVERYGLEYSHHMTTNAYLLTEERATKLLEWGCNDFQITLDGLPEDHDCKRVGRDGSPTHAVILDNLRSMRERSARFVVKLRVNFDQKNLPRLGAFIEAVSEEFGGDPRFRLNFHAVGRWGGENDADLEICGIQDKRVVMDQLRDQAQEAGLNPGGGIHERSTLGSHVCYAARPYHFIVGATGKLMKCTIALDDLDANVVGHLRPDGTMEVIDEKLVKWVAPHFENDSLCQSCHMLPGCQGAACPLTRVTDNVRHCCGTKSELKREMRFTLARSEARSKAALATAGD